MSRFLRVKSGSGAVPASLKSVRVPHSPSAFVGRVPRFSFAPP